MSNIILNQSVISISANVGQFSQKKFNMLNEVLKGYIIEAMPLPEMLRFKIDENEIVCITNNSINYYIGGPQYNKERVNGIVKNIFDVLELDTEVMAVIDIQGKTAAKDSFVESLNEYKEKFGEAFENLSGVGYRFFFDGEDHKDDLKKEPLIADRSFFYHQLTRNFKVKPVNVDVVLESLEDAIVNIDKLFK